MQTISTILQVLPYGTRYTDRFGADQMMPRFIAGVRAKIDFELRGPAGEGDELPPYDVQTMVNGATSFFFALDGDYDHTTTPKLLRQSGISVTYDDDGYGTIHAELPPTAQDGIIQYLRTSESIVLIGEIGGLDDNLEKIFSLPVTVQVTNPVWLPGETSSQETPSASDPDYLTAAQVRAYVVSQVAAQLEDAMEQVAKGDPGDKGDKGDPPTLAIGTVEPGTLGAEIEPATDEHGDDIPGSYILNLTIPDSASPVINIGTVTDGETPSAGIELEEDGSYTLSLTLPRGQMGTGIQPLADAWSESTAYSIYQAVRHNGAWWYSLQDGNTGHEPPATRADSAYWKLIVQDGRDGVTPVFSFNPSTDSPSSDAWHEPPYLATDKYFRLSLDGGFTWGVAMPMAMPSVPIVFQYNPTADGDWAEPTAASSSAQYSTVYGKYMRARNSVSGWGQAIYVLGLDEDNLQRDPQDLRVRFAESVNDDWHATLREGDAAVQISNASGTILQTYTFSLNAGETVDSVEFSPYENPWHSPVTENDYYLRISPDGGTTFSDPILLRATNVPTGEGTSADLSNYYTKSQVDTRLANKAPSTHTHTKSQITDFAHAHVLSDITGLAAAFANKQDTLPSGAAGKFLKKTASGVEWDDPSGGGGGGSDFNPAVSDAVVGVVGSEQELLTLWENNTAIRGKTKFYIGKTSNLDDASDIRLGHIYAVIFASAASTTQTFTWPELLDIPGTWAEFTWRRINSFTGDSAVMNGDYEYDDDKGYWIKTTRDYAIITTNSASAFDGTYILPIEYADVANGSTDPVSDFVDDLGDAGSIYSGPISDVFPWTVVYWCEYILDNYGVVWRTVKTTTANIKVLWLDVTPCVAGTCPFVDPTDSIASMQSRIATLEALAMGTLTVTHTGTAPAGAKWSVDSGTTWRDFGTSATLAPGSYTVTFKSVTGYTAPSSQSVTLTAGGTQSVSVAYTAVATTGTVTLTFSGTPPQGAGWTVDGNSYTSGQTATLDPGTYAITYASVTGYDSPSTPTSVTVAAGDTITLSAEYTEQQAEPSGPFYVVSGATGYEAGVNGTYTLDSSKTGRSNSPVWTNGTYYLAYGYDGDNEEMGWALTTITPTSSLYFNHPPPHWVVSNDSSAPPTSGWSGGVTVTQGS